MKKLLGALFIILNCSFFISISANPVSQQTAKIVATNFYGLNFKSVTPNLSLIYTEYAKDGQPAYYVYNVNSNDGFIIVAGEDAAHPILGYSNKGQYVVPANTTNNVAWWMNCRKQEIEMARIKGISATNDIAEEWNAYVNNTEIKRHVTMSSVLPLTQSTWNQSPYYNDMCPGGSVTGCVACAMAQIMRYWSYPSHGRGYSGYYELSADGFWSNFGYLAANYDTSNYVWSAMPYNVTGTNNEVAKLMYDCGVSVCMNYNTYESGAWVIDGDYPVCSQNSYVKYFGYNAKTIQGVYKSNYTLPNWILLIENELNNNRPVQYVGNDSVNNAGHTWVCDGYDVNNNFHMNWGWGGSSNGYFAPNAVMVSGYNFDWWDEAVIGIEPAPVAAYFGASPTFGCGNLIVNFKDSSISNSPITSYNWIFPGGNPSTSPSPNPTVTYNTPGTYDVTEIIANINGTDTVVRKAYISVAATGTLPMVQNFQSATFPPAGWVLNNPNDFSYTWQLSNNVGGYGASTQCMVFNNTQVIADYNTIYTGLWVTPPGKPAVDVIGQRQQIYTPEYNFTNTTKPEIYFDVAYAPFSSAFSDTLQIYYSTDCGATFHMVYQKGGMTLGTTGNMVSSGADTNANGIFVPASNNWRTDTIHIPAIAGAANVMFSFENLSGNGAAMYIDNINIPGVPTSVPALSAKPSVNVYPNPNNGQFIIGLANVSGNSYVKIYNVLGQEVYMSSLKNGNTPIDLYSQSKGIYIYRIFSETGDAISTGRLAVE